MTDRVFPGGVCCFTGHRDLEPWEEQKVYTRMRYRVEPLINQGTVYFGVGGALGFDMLAAEYLLHVRDEMGKRIKIISVLPYPDYREGWPEEMVRRQDEIIRRSDKVVYACQEKEPEAFLKRDRMLVDGSNYCICYCHRLTGGTAYTVRYAISRGIPVYNCSSWDLEQLNVSR